MPRLGFRGRQQLASLGEAAAFKILQRFPNLSDYIDYMHAVSHSLSTQAHVSVSAPTVPISELERDETWGSGSFLDHVLLENEMLSSQLSSAADKICCDRLLKQIRKFKCDMQDMSVETSVREDVHKCILKELMGKNKWSVEESNMKFVAIHEFYEIYFKGFPEDARDIEDSYMESVIMQEICGTIFREAAQDTERRLYLMKMKYEGQSERLVSLEASVLESEKVLNSVTEEKEQLQQELVKISALLEEKEKVALETGSMLMKEMERADQIYQDLSSFKRESNMIKIFIFFFRLKRIKFQCDVLVQNAALSRKTELVYKQRLERRYSDLQKAEAEVDLLGDKVNALLSLHEKIYIGLNHYSPILQHYPGVSEPSFIPCFTTFSCYKDLSFFRGNYFIVLDKFAQELNLNWL
ncbi:hypothetical protein IFM89_017620 [Coptis chinensis]|uniref:Uncharacterized protein n=1 Tax=Coptis chinensis TaxID=261450 RepID=A0A835LIU9_9MAGN|nr:hypothetical protein IFM89_017620 [Coptis chinensis]